MTSYAAPLRDMRFALYELSHFAEVTALPGCGEVTPELVDPILDAGGTFCAEVLAPLNRSGDEAGCTFENGVVRTPDGFKQAYAAYCRDGWPALHADPAFGGQGLPKTVSLMFEEMICSANLSFGMYPGLSHGAYEALHAHGTPALRQTYLPKLVSGEWSGTMCLTEPHCGTDLGLLRTRAVPDADGSFRITGTKIFISAGEHDLTSNILHLVIGESASCASPVACPTRRLAAGEFRCFWCQSSCPRQMATPGCATRSPPVRLSIKWESRRLPPA